MCEIYYIYYPSPIGNLLLLAKEDGLIALELEKEQHSDFLPAFQPHTAASAPIQHIFCKTCAILDRYFAGEKIVANSLDFLHLQGSDFQKAVWQMLLTIPYGQTMGYGEIAQRLGKPNAARAVGGAVGRNPISILVPCHRVLGKNQSLTGFGGGLSAKRYLLQLEQIHYLEQGIEQVKPKVKRWR